MKLEARILSKASPFEQMDSLLHRSKHDIKERKDFQVRLIYWHTRKDCRWKMYKAWQIIVGAVIFHRRHLRQLGDEDNLALLAEEKERQQELEEEESEWENGSSKLMSSKNNGNLVGLFKHRAMNACKPWIRCVPFQR